MRSPAFSRDRLAVLLALATIAVLGVAFVATTGTQFLMPGPLTSAHGSIEKCSACHTKSGEGKMSWAHGLVAGDPRADSKACLTCHKMPDTAFNAHSASAEVLEKSTKRLAKAAAQTPVPQSARMQNIAFPTHDVVAGGLTCATCHQEHQGAGFNLNKISNEQCRSCHKVKFDSFDGNHPEFENYPFKKRTPIIFDHAGHFGKHYPEVAKKEPGKRIPETCSSCHNSQDDRRVMGVAPFEKTCSGCHLNQITGKERATGPKGIAFLALPGLDLTTLKKKNVSIGEWPEDSEAALTPFMKAMISRDEPGRALIKTIDAVNLQELSKASDEQIKAVTALAWEIKKLFHTLITGKASDVLGDLNIGGGAKLSAALVADLTASIPRDVLTGAQQEWLPNLGTEIASRPAANDEKQDSPVDSKPKGSGASETAPAANGRQVSPSSSAPEAGSEDRAAGKAGTASANPGSGKDTRSATELPPAMRAGVGDPENGGGSANSEAAVAKSINNDKEEEAASDQPGETSADGRKALPSGTPRSIRARGQNNAEPGENNGDDKKAAPSAGGPASKGAGGDGTADKAAEPAATAGDKPGSTAVGEKSATSPKASPGKATEQTDDLLFPTDDELREMKTGVPSAAGKASPPPAEAASKDAAPVAQADSTDAAKPDASTPAAPTPGAAATPVVSIGSDVDPESWAEYGGWYRQDFAIFYRPTGHKDKFLYAWLFLTGPQAAKEDKSAAAAVFASLTHKEAQGSCTKCHSVDDIAGKGQLVNFSPPSVMSKQGRFTNFIHEPHFGIMENRGCLTCHKLEKDRPYLKGYEQGNASAVSSNFGAVKKELCQTCHTSGMARQDCLLCHDYHVNGAATPIMTTKLPIQ